MFDCLLAIGGNASGLQPLLDAAVAQWLERNSYKVVVGGSIPPCRTLTKDSKFVFFKEIRYAMDLHYARFVCNRLCDAKI